MTTTATNLNMDGNAAATTTTSTSPFLRLAIATLLLVDAGFRQVIQPLHLCMFYFRGGYQHVSERFARIRYVCLCMCGTVP